MNEDVQRYYEAMDRYDSLNEGDESEWEDSVKDTKEDITTILYEEIDIAYIGGGMTVPVGHDKAIERITKYIKEFYVTRD